MDLDVVDLQFVFLTLLLGVVHIPWQIWCCVTLYKDWNKVYIVKRRRVFVAVSLIDLIVIELS